MELTSFADFAISEKAGGAMVKEAAFLGSGGGTGIKVEGE
jgi:hypothetical protein